MPTLAPRRFAQATGALLVLATLALGLGIQRLVAGDPVLGYPLIATGVAAAGLAFSLRIEDDPSRRTLLLLTREACPTCEEAKAILEHVQEDAGFAWWEVDVAQADLAQRYSAQVPVLFADGTEVASLQVTEDDVRSTLTDGPPS